MTQGIAFDYKIEEKNFNIAKYIFEKNGNLEPYTEYMQANLGSLLPLLGGFELEVENNMDDSQLAQYGKVGTPEFNNNIYSVSITLPNEWYQAMLVKFKKLYPNVPDNEVNSYIANMGVAFLTKVDQLGMKMPNKQELQAGLDPNTQLTLKHN